MNYLRAVPKPQRSVPQRVWREKAILITKKLVRLRGECSRCGRKAPRYTMHGVHIVPVRFGNICADPENVECMCAFCHTTDNDSAHLNERDFHEWFDAKYPNRRSVLRVKAEQVCALDFEEVYAERLQQYHQALVERQKA